MSERNKKPENSKKTEQHKKSANTSKVKKKVSKDSDKKMQQTGTRQDDWNDPTGNSHLSGKS